MKNLYLVRIPLTRTLYAIASIFCCLLFISSCDSPSIEPSPDFDISRVAATDDLALFLHHVEFSEVSLTQRMPGTNYVGTARGHGIIPAGEYAGQHFNVSLRAEYSGPGLETLVSGKATVSIQGDKYKSVNDPLLQSFCCGEGHLMDLGTHWEFSMFGQVVHDGHNHLFAGLGSTDGTMNMNIADQSGTVVIPAVPPHDPGIGLILDIPSPSARVRIP